MYFISRVLCIYNDHLPVLLFQNAIRATPDMAPHSWIMDKVLAPYSWIMDNVMAPYSWIMDNVLEFGFAYVTGYNNNPNMDENLIPEYVPLAPETVPDFPNQCKDVPSVSYIPAFYIL